MTYFAGCDDCKAFVRLDKFYAWDLVDKEKDDPEELEKIMAIPGAGCRAARLMIFVRAHNGHRIEVGDEDAPWVEKIFDEDDSGWREELPWPD